MAGLANPRKEHRFVLEIDGLNAFLVQEVELPDFELEEVVHGAPMNTPNVKTPGKPVVGNLIIRKLVPANQADTWVWDWMALCIDGNAEEYKKTGTLRDYLPSGTGTVQQYFCGEIFPMKVETPNRLRQSANNLIEAITFSVETFFPLESPGLKSLFSSSSAGAIGAAFGFGSESS